MADKNDKFTADIEAQLDLSKAESQWSTFQSKLQKTPLKIDIDFSLKNNSSLDKVISNIENSLKQAGINAGKYFQSELDNQINKSIGKSTKLAQNAANLSNRSSSYSKTDIKRINDLLSTKTYDARISSVENRLKSYLETTKGYDQVSSSLKTVKDAYEDLKVAKAAFDADASDDNLQALVLANEKVVSSMKLAENEFKILSNAQEKALSPPSIASAKKSFASYFENNTKAARAYKDEVELLEQKLNSMATVSDKAEFDTLFKNLQTKAIQEGNTGKWWPQEVGRAFKQIGQFVGTYGIIQQIPQTIAQMYQEVVKVDSAMTNLYKVTDETNAVYEKFLDNAGNTSKELGRNISSYITQTSEWAKLGYDITNSSELAKISSIYANVGEVTDETAVSDMVTAMKAYNIEASDAIRIADSYNEVANRFATEASDLGEGISNSASSLALAGNDFDQSVAMITGMSEITQEAGEAGNALKILSMRIRGYDEETQSYTNDVEELEGSIANLTKTASTPGGISLFTDATKETYKSTYQLMEEVSAIWGDLSDKVQAQLLETLAGKNRGNQISALISAFQSGQVQKAYETSINAEGSAIREQERWMESLEAKQQQLSASFQEFSMTMIDSDFAKGLLDVLNQVLEIITQIIDKVGILNPLLSGIFAAKTIKSFTKNFDESAILYVVG